MKKLFLSFFICLLLGAPCAALSDAPFHYESPRLGFSLTLPDINEREILANARDNQVDFFHAASYQDYGGLIGSIEVVSPRSNFFMGHYDDMAYQIIAMGIDRVYLWKAAAGGANTSNESLESFQVVSAAFAIENLRQNLIPTQRDDLPVLQKKNHLSYLPTNNGLVSPDQPLTRSDFAEMLFVLLDADNKGNDSHPTFSDTIGKDCAQAVNYLASYGILAGYADGTFQPDVPISRAAFAVLLHRCQFAPPVSQYGEEVAEFPDVPTDYWAKNYITSAHILGWMRGSSDGNFYPEQKITRAEAVTAINRMLGRDESATAIDSISSPFSDLSPNHWAYANILEAAGILTDTLPQSSFQENEFPADSIYHFINEKDGWIINESQLFRTSNGGKLWRNVGEKLTFIATDLFFFDEKNGVLLGYSQDGAYTFLKTADGGENWDSLLDKQSFLETKFPIKYFPSAEAFMNSIVSADLRPAANDAIYLTIQYHPYESIYAHDFKAIWQTVIEV